MKIESAIICDDTRVENTQKFILIGVYRHNILVESFPAACTFLIFIQLYFNKAGNFPFEIRILKNKKQVAIMEGEFQVSDPSEIVSFHTPKIQLAIDEPCTLTFQIHEKGQRWKSIKKTPVNLQPKND